MINTTKMVIVVGEIWWRKSVWKEGKTFHFFLPLMSLTKVWWWYKKERERPSGYYFRCPKRFSFLRFSLFSPIFSHHRNQLNIQSNIFGNVRNAVWEDWIMFKSLVSSFILFLATSTSCQVILPAATLVSTGTSSQYRSQDVSFPQPFFLTRVFDRLPS